MITLIIIFAYLTIGIVFVAALGILDWPLLILEMMHNDGFDASNGWIGAGVIFWPIFMVGYIVGGILCLFYFPLRYVCRGLGFVINLVIRKEGAPTSWRS